MKLKTIVLFILAIATSTFMTGCCTSSLLGSHPAVNIDTFNPKAVYKSENLQSFALEGTSHNHPKNEAIYIWRGKPGVKAYLILSNEVNSMASAI